MWWNGNTRRYSSIKYHVSSFMQKKQFIIHNTRYIILGFLFLMAFLERTVFDLGPNYEFLTAAIVLSSYFLNRKTTFLLTFLVIAFSDRIIGNSKIFLFTWSGFLIPSFFLSSLVKKGVKYQVSGIKKKTQLLPILKPLYTIYNILYTKVLPLTVVGISANFFFFIWTNFGVWMLDSWGMYTKDVGGLMHCYINGLPFLKNQITSSILFIPFGYFAFQAVYFFHKKWSPKTPSSALFFKPLLYNKKRLPGD